MMDGSRGSRKACFTMDSFKGGFSLTGPGFVEHAEKFRRLSWFCRTEDSNNSNADFRSEPSHRWKPLRKLNIYAITKSLPRPISTRPPSGLRLNTTEPNMIWSRRYIPESYGCLGAPLPLPARQCSVQGNDKTKKTGDKRLQQTKRRRPKAFSSQTVGSAVQSILSVYTSEALAALHAATFRLPVC